MIKFLDLQQQYLSIKDEIDSAIQSVIGSAAFIGGEYVVKFEQAFGDYQQAKHCIGVGNGTDALEIVIEGLSLPKESEIIVPANSFIASAEAVTRTGHRVVFCDCDPDTYTISPSSILSKITSKTKAIMAVHLYGQPCEMDEIMSIAQAYGLYVIEDCAQAHGAEYKGQRVGTFGVAGTFSFYPGKNLGAFGDAGAIVTNNSELAETCRMIANHGRLQKYNHAFEGRNSRLDGLQAAILMVKLKHLPTWIRRRRAVAQYYEENLLLGPELILPKELTECESVYHLYVIRTSERDALQQFLHTNGVQTGIHYPISLPKLKAYEYCCQGEEDFVANNFDSQYLSLPIGEHLSEEQVAQVVNKVKAFFL